MILREMRFRKAIGIVVVMMFAMTLFAAPLFAQGQTTGALQEYRAITGDRVMISVPQRPDLNRQLVVDDSGNITLPLIGAIAVKGLSATEIQLRVLQSLNNLYPSVNQVNVTVQPASGQGIYVVGQIQNPGKYIFPSPPNIWEAIREAGGALSAAELTVVRLVKNRAQGGSTQIVNVLAALESGTTDTLPILEGGDSVIIPAKADNTYTGSTGVNVFGAVPSPGVYLLEGRHDITAVILRAGGPTRNAKLSEIKIIRPIGNGQVQTIGVNLNNFVESGDPTSNPRLQDGDTIVIPEGSRLTTDYRFMLSLVSTALTITALIISINN